MHTELLKVTGMTCGGCSSKVTHVLQAIDGVSAVVVSLSAGEVTVQYDERRTSLDHLKSAVMDAGYGVGPINSALSQSKVAAAPNAHSV